MTRAFLALAATAVSLATLDVVHKAVTPTGHLHGRSGGYVVLAVALVSLWTAALIATRSASLATAGGVVTGGALANLVSLALWPGVPNPLVAEGIAFNLADVFVVAGFLLTATAVLAFTARNRERLSEPLR